MKKVFCILMILAVAAVLMPVSAYGASAILCPDCGGLMNPHMDEEGFYVQCENCCCRAVIDEEKDVFVVVSHCEPDDGTETKSPTCTETGLREYRCRVNPGHPVIRTEEIPARGHSPVTDAAVAPTETATGLTEGSHCSVCGAVLKAQEVIPATGHTHTVVVDPAVSATCSSGGLTEGSHCSACGEIIKAQTAIPATGHTAVKDAAFSATCTKPGLTEGSHCSVCGTIITPQKEVAALGHLWVNWEAAGEWKHTVRCARGCGERKTGDCTVVILPQEDPDAEPVSFCPVCGTCEGAELSETEGLTGNETPRNASLRVFSLDVDADHQYIAIACVSGGELVQPDGKITFSLSDDLKDVSFALVEKDGTETAVETDGGELTLDFTPEGQDPVQVIFLRR